MLATTTLALAALLCGGPSAGDSFALRATRVHVGDGTVLENAIVLVKDGKIVDVGQGVAFDKDVPLIEHDGDLSAGLVALRDYAGIGAEGADSTRAVMDAADLRYAFDSDHPDMARLAESGITTVVLAPGSGSNVVAGMPVVVKPTVRVLRAKGSLHVDLSASGTSFNRYPSSYAGVLEVLEERFAAGEGAFGELKAGRMTVMLEAESRAETSRALDFASRHKLRGYLVDSQRAGELAAKVKASGLGVAVGPFAIGGDRKEVESAVSLAKAGVPIGFALDTPTNAPAMLRLSAATAMRAGLDRDAAFKALTSGAAALAGVGDKVGAVRAGMEADLVLWTGDPVDPTSRAVAVYIDGDLVHEAPETDEEDED
ncbi:MAG: amidohydrolase family protein [Planctomycetota bacterium]|nr:amidohydrolase family protein [Planctomycetota bacterium]